MCNQKEPDFWNLRGMHGIVYEWCYDWYGDYSGMRSDNPLGLQAHFSSLDGVVWIASFKLISCYYFYQ